MLVYRLTVHQQKYFYFREDIQNETGIRNGESQIWLTGLILYQSLDVF